MPAAGDDPQSCAPMGGVVAQSPSPAGGGGEKSPSVLPESPPVEEVDEPVDELELLLLEELLVGPPAPLQGSQMQLDEVVIR